MKLAPWMRTAGYHAARWGWVPGLAILVYLAYPSGAGDRAPVLRPGSVAPQDIVAEFSFVVNKTDEEVAREAAELANTAMPVYEFRQAAYDAALATMRGFFAAAEAAPSPEALQQAAVSPFRLTLTLDESRYLARRDRRQAMQSAVEQLFGVTLSRAVAAAGVMQAEASPRVIVRRGPAERTVPRDSVLNYSDYLAQARQLQPDRRSSVGEAAYLKVVGAFWRPTLVLNQVETDRRRDDLRRNVDRAKYVVRAGERIVGAREVVTQEAHEQLVALHRELVRRGATASLGTPAAMGAILRDSLVLSVFWVLLFFYRRESYREPRQVAIIGVLFALGLGGSAVVARIAPNHPELIPLPFAAMLLTVLFNGRVSMIGAMIMAIVIALQPAFHDQPALFFCTVSGVTAALSVRVMRRRSHVYGMVALVAAAYAIGAIAIGVTSDWSWVEVAKTALRGGANGLGSAAIAMLALPVAEYFTQVTTDLTLLELSDPSRPLLRRLSVEAPGTYAHSIAMANLCEAACNAIGANGLLARVGCYYHDVGKVLNPQYFVENQSGGANPHDRLKASQSAQIIRKHVTEGLKLAEDGGVPPVVRAFIPEHHGTSDMTYFLDRARKQDGDGGSGARKSGEYRYPGPRPRSAETGVAMIADSVEASLRVLEDPTINKVRDVIDHIVRTKLESGQLDEAPLTLQQIERVKEEFVRVLSGMYHDRIDYPESSGGISANWKSGKDA
jgi:cyclic-di-AMP phosphodiesterase PgpH